MGLILLYGTSGAFNYSMEYSETDRFSLF